MTIREYLRAWLDVLWWGCLDWHHPGDDECFAASGSARRDAAAWRLALLLPYRWHGWLERLDRRIHPTARTLSIGVDIGAGVDTAVLVERDGYGIWTVLDIARSSGRL